MRYRATFIAWVLLGITLVACGEDTAGTDSTQPTAPAVVVITNDPLTAPTPNMTAIIALTLQAQGIPVQTFPTATVFTGQTSNTDNTGGIIPATRRPDCPIPQGWQAYTIVSGDSLGLIASAVGSTVELIQVNNCLPDPNGIIAGDVIYLPALPPGAFPLTPTRAATLTFSAPIATQTSQPSTRAPVIPQLLQASPTFLRSDGAYVTLQRTIELNLGVLADADRVRYRAATSATDPNPVQIGVDNDPFDGTRFSYTLSDFDNELYFTAVAENEFGNSVSNTLRVVYDPTFGSQPGQLSIQPYIGFDLVVYTLQSGATVTISWTQAPATATRIDFFLSPSGGSTQLIGSDANPRDGVSLSWLVPANLRAQLYAQAILSTGQATSSPALNVYSESN